MAVMSDERRRLVEEDRRTVSESHPLRQIRSFVFNSLARLSEFSRVLAGNDVRSERPIRLGRFRNTPVLATRAPNQSHVGASGHAVAPARTRSVPALTDDPSDSVTRFVTC